MKPIARPICCMNCGHRWPDPKADWPRTCDGCSCESFKNPLPVAVVIARKSKLPDTDPSDPGLGAS